jgi:hypothetical protein
MFSTLHVAIYCNPPPLVLPRIPIAVQSWWDCVKFGSEKEYINPAKRCDLIQVLNDV